MFLLFIISFAWNFFPSALHIYVCHFIDLIALCVRASVHLCFCVLALILSICRGKHTHIHTLTYSNQIQLSRKMCDWRKLENIPKKNHNKLSIMTFAKLYDYFLFRLNINLNTHTHTQVVLYAIAVAKREILNSKKTANNNAKIRWHRVHIIMLYR